MAGMIPARSGEACYRKDAVLGAGSGAGSDFNPEQVGAASCTTGSAHKLLMAQYLCCSLHLHAHTRPTVQNDRFCHYESPALTIELQAPNPI